DVTGAVRYELKGLPEGVTAELRLNHAANPAFLNPVMSFKVTLGERDDRPYIVDGAARMPPESHITVWRGPDGKLKNFAVLTSVEVSGATVRLGLPVDQSRVATGILFTFHADDPSRIIASASYLDGMMPVDETMTPTI